MIASLRAALSEQRPEIVPVSLLFALSVLLHVAQDFAYNPLMATLLVAASLAIILFPAQLILLPLLSVIVCVDFLLPVSGNSNSTFLQWVIALTLLAGYAGRRKPEDFALTTYPVLRLLLLVMYFFGIFHKLNDGWIHPIESCAVQVWKMIDLPGLPDLTNHRWFTWLLIWGTLIAEAVFIAGLMAKGRVKTVCMLAGITFHAFIALSGFRSYYAFSVQAFMLYACFLPTDRTYPRLQRLGSRLAFLAVAILLTLLVDKWPLLPWYVIRIPLWIVLSIGFLGWCWHHLRRNAPARSALLSPVRAVNLIALFYFLHSSGPYLGMQTAESLTMFSNLYTERTQGRTNHWLIPSRLDLFPWQRETIRLYDSNYPSLVRRSRASFGVLSLYDLLKHLRHRPERHASFDYKGAYYHRVHYRDIAHLGMLWPPLLDHVFSFKSQLVEKPMRCRG